jgi:hypothetical protein
MNRGLWLAVLGAVVFVSLTFLSCATTAQYNQGRVETKQTIYKTAPTPGANWTRISIAEADLAFWNDRLDASILLNSTCEETNNTPVRSLANQLFFGIEQKVFLEQKQVPVDGRWAWYSLVTGQLDGAPVKVAAYTLVKNYCTYDLSYTAPPDRFDKGLGDFQKLVETFRVVKRKR